MNEPQSSDASMDQERMAALAEEFAQRLRRGEHPSIEGYAQGQPGLADQIRAIFPAIAAMEQAGGKPSGDTTSLSERQGETIGRYKLLERLGEGGFGVVYMAEQEQPIRRKVALKVIKPGLDTQQVIARFEAERQALAMMDHENIAKVLDAGATDSGRPYFVMELVHGMPITTFCDRHSLSPRERLELFMQVCRAVQHAHTKGVIHRDIKPTNVLVALQDGKVVPKVIDFGIAKATHQLLTDKTLFTQFAQLVGTPLYMSPEQAELGGLNVDTRSDIYSLGALLYELLTGTTPIDKERLKQAAFDEVRRVIRDEEPPRPSTRLSSLGEEAAATVFGHYRTEYKRLGQIVRGDLDWIVMKCLEKERARRYETADALAQDILRHLTDEPVQARPPSRAYMLRKFVRRHRGAVIAAATVGLTLIAGIIGTAWQARVADAQRAEAVLQRNAKQTALDAKTAALAAEAATREQALAALETLTDQAIAWELARKFSLTNEDRKFLGKIVALHESFAALKGDTPESRVIRAHAQYRIGFFQAKLGEVPAARISLDNALALNEQLTRDFPRNPDYRRAEADTRNELGLLFRNTSDRAGADFQWRQAADIYEQLAKEFPAHQHYREEAVGIHNRLGALFWDDGKLDAALVEWRKCVAGYEQLWAEFPESAEYKSEFASNLSNVATVFKQQGKPDDAEKMLRRAVELGKQIVRDHPGGKHIGNLAEYHEKLSTVLRARQPQEAANEIRESLMLHKKLVTVYPALPHHLDGLARAHLSYGLLLVELGKRNEAKAEYLEAIELYERLVKGVPSVLDYAVTLGGCYCNLGQAVDGEQPAEALEYYGRAISTLTKVIERDPRSIQCLEFLRNSYDSRARVLDALGRTEEAINDQERAIDSNRSLSGLLGPDRSQEAALQMGSLHISRGNLLRRLGKRAQAKAEHLEAIAIYQGLVSAAPSNLFHAVYLAGCYCNLGQTVDDEQPEEGLEHYGRAIDSLTRILERDPKMRLAVEFLRNTYDSRVRLLKRLGRTEEANADQEHETDLDHQLSVLMGADQSVAAAEKAGSAHMAHGVSFWQLGKRDKAKAEYLEAIAIYQGLVSAAPSVLPHAVNLAGCYCNLGQAVEDEQPEEGLKHYGRAINFLIKVVESDPHTPQALEFLRNTYDSRTRLLKRLGRTEEANADQERVAELERKLAKP
jgi:serine/threonine protein kinase/tetratricopeptide (TPR) repeat protein